MDPQHADFVIEIAYHAIAGTLFLGVLAIAVLAIYGAWRVVRYTYKLLR